MTSRTARSASGWQQLPVRERRARGKAARERSPRGAHAAWEPAPDRRDPIELLEEQATTRVLELLPIRYGRMAASPFAFYRGAAAIMAEDLARTPTAGFRVQLCGDAHLSNFGSYASAERSLVFDINDFDESMPGPWEWDLKRLATSFAIAGRELGLSPVDRRDLVLGVVTHYRNAMADFAEMRNLEVWYSHLAVDEILATVRARGTKKQVKRVEGTIGKAMSRDNLQAFSKLTHVVDGHSRIKSDPPILVPLADLVSADDAAVVTEHLRRILRGYRRTLSPDRRELLDQFRLVDVARKVVGVGSVGTQAWVALLLGRDGDDPLFLQFKEAQPSVLARHVGLIEFKNEGQRVVTGQRRMQATSDIFLGWHRVKGPDGRRQDFYVRQLRDWKASAMVERMHSRELAPYGHLCAWTLARAHARTGDRIAIAAYMGTSAVLDEAIAAFSEVYAEQNERDHATLCGAIAEGRIEAETG